MKQILIVAIGTIALIGCGKKEEAPANPETGGNKPEANAPANADKEEAPANPEANAPANADMEIFEACTKGNLKAVEAHIAGGTDLNQRGPDQNTPLIL